MSKPREKMFFKGNTIDSLDSFVVACDRDGYVFIGDKPVCSYYIGKNRVSKIILMIRDKRLSYANRNPKYIEKPKKVIEYANSSTFTFRGQSYQSMLVGDRPQIVPVPINDSSWAYVEDDENLPF